MGDSMIFSDRKWEFHGKIRTTTEKALPEELCRRDSVRKQWFLSRIMALFLLHRSLCAKPAYRTSSISLAVQDYWGKRVVAEVSGCKGSSVEE